MRGVEEGPLQQAIAESGITMEAGGSSTCDPHSGMAGMQEQDATETTDAESESVYSGNLDSPEDAQDSVYSRSLGSVASSAGWNDGRISAAADWKPLPALIPITSSLATCMGEPGPELGSFITEPFDSDEILSALSITAAIDAGSHGTETHMGGDEPNGAYPQTEAGGRQEGIAGESFEIHQQDGTLDVAPSKEPINEQRGEKPKNKEPELATAGGCTVSRRLISGLARSEHGSPESCSSGFGPPQETTGSFLMATPTKDKPPSVPTMDADEEKRSWKHERAELNTPATPFIRYSNDATATPRKKRAQVCRRLDRGRSTGSDRRSSSTESRQGHDPRDRRGSGGGRRFDLKTDHGYARFDPRTRESGKGFRQMRPVNGRGPTEAQKAMYEKKLANKAYGCKEKIKKAREELEKLKKEQEGYESQSSQSGSGHGGGRSKGRGGRERE